MSQRVLAGTVATLVILLAATGWAQTADDLQKFPHCTYCGMDRQKFAHSRMLVDYDDGSSQGTCSIHCTAVDLALHLDKTPKATWVGDYHTKKLIDADKAAWVIGGKKPGVMTKNAKWAFADKSQAEAFIKENDGKLGTYDDAMKATFEDMYADIKMIRAKRAKMKMQHQGPKQ